MVTNLPVEFKDRRLRGESFFRKPRSAEILNEMESTPFSRKLEANGRLLIPIKLREQMGLTAGREYYFFTHEQDGHRFICIDCGKTPESELDKAMKLLEANGYKMTIDK